MPSFAYTAIDDDGATRKGQIMAADELSALDALSAKNLVVVDCKSAKDAVPWWAREISLTGGSAGARTRDLEQFFSTFAALMQAKIPLIRALRICADQAGSTAMQRGLMAIAEGVSNGQSFGDALDDQDSIFPNRFARLLALGERSNQLEEIAIRALSAIRSEGEARRQLRSALIYPAILMLMSLLVLSLVVFFLAPTLVPVFATAGSEAPTILAAMVTIRDFLLDHWSGIFVATAAVILLTVIFRRAIAQVFEFLAMRAPFSGNYIRQRETLKICQSLGLLLTSGATLNEALNAMADEEKRAPYRGLVSEAASTIVAGGGLKDGLAVSPLIDDTARALILAGEESDRLPQMLEVATATLNTQCKEAMAQAVRLLTPMLTLILGLGVGAIILSTITAILDLNDVAF